MKHKHCNCNQGILKGGGAGRYISTGFVDCTKRPVTGVTFKCLVKIKSEHHVQIVLVHITGLISKFCEARVMRWI